MKRPHPLDGVELLQFTPADQVDLVCDAFEESLIRGEIPQMEDFLNRCDDSLRESLFTELLLLDREYRIKRGGGVSREDYQHRFPRYSTIIQGLEFPTIDERHASDSCCLEAKTPVTGGSTLSHFELLEELGAGAAGTVWKARDSRLKRLVAVKIPRQATRSDSERERFLREGQACAQLRHPNIVAVYEVGEDLGRAFIVTAFIDGLNLRDWLRRTPPTPRKAAELTVQLADALHHAHDRGIIHRDLKPANVLIDSAGLAHVTDFGLAKWTADHAALTVEGGILGTPAYMSPEQARGEASTVDRRSDVYGLGALLYEMLTGQAPFAGDVAAIVHQVIHDEPRAPRTIACTVPRDLETICVKAMEKNPDDRYQSAEEMAVDLRRYLDGRSILARPVGIVGQFWRSCRRRPASVLAFSLAIIVSIGAFALASIVHEKNRLKAEKMRLEGYQHVEIITEPAGALIAVVPADAITGGPDSDPAKVVRPVGTTPLDMYLRSGEYFIEAAFIKNGSLWGFAEVTRVVPSPGDLSVALKHTLWRYDSSRQVVTTNRIQILPTAEAREGMVEVFFDGEIRRRYPDVPETLLVDTHQTLPGTFTHITGAVVDSITFDHAVSRLEKLGKRLPTAREFDAIVEQLARPRSESKPNIVGTADEYPEWTSTRSDFGDTAPGLPSIMKDMLLLKGYAVPQQIEGYIASADDTQLFQARSAPNLPTALRGVHCAKPRFIQW